MSAPLSNFLTVLAAEVVSEVAAFKRSSAAAHRAYLSAGAKLVDARANARRGQWAPFLAACGVSERVARNMMRLARAGLTADEVTERGGVQASLESLREAEKAELNSGNGTPAGAPLAGESPPESLAEPAETPSLAHETEAAAGEPPAVRESGPRRPASAIPWAANALALAMGEDAALSPAARRRADKLARGECLDCSRPTVVHVRCEICRARIAEADRRRRERARLGAALAPRLAEAARTGRGVRLTAAEVAALTGPDLDLAT